MRTPMMIYKDAMKKKKNKKGFSLVELIVVLVIMAILMAALIPSLTGYIRQARQSNAKDECSSCVQAAQTIVSSAYAAADGKYVNNSGDDVTFSDFGDSSAVTCTSKSPANYFAVTKTLAEVQGDVQSIVITKGQVTKLVYKSSNSQYVTYENYAYTVSSTAPSTGDSTDED